MILQKQHIVFAEQTLNEKYWKEANKYRGKGEEIFLFLLQVLRLLPILAFLSYSVNTHTHTHTPEKARFTKNSYFQLAPQKACPDFKLQYIVE